MCLGEYSRVAVQPFLCKFLGRGAEGEAIRLRPLTPSSAAAGHWLTHQQYDWHAVLQSFVWWDRPVTVSLLLLVPAYNYKDKRIKKLMGRDLSKRKKKQCVCGRVNTTCREAMDNGPDHFMVHVVYVHIQVPYFLYFHFMGPEQNESHSATRLFGPRKEKRKSLRVFLTQWTTVSSLISFILMRRGPPCVRNNAKRRNLQSGGHADHWSQT